jgi:hypothetical protein
VDGTTTWCTTQVSTAWRTTQASTAWRDTRTVKTRRDVNLDELGQINAQLDLACLGVDEKQRRAREQQHALTLLVRRSIKLDHVCNVLESRPWGGLEQLLHHSAHTMLSQWCFCQALRLEPLGNAVRVVGL